jgi:hypothetical protein
MKMRPMSLYESGESNGTVSLADLFECDAVMHLKNGSYGLVEVKLGGEKLINEGIQNLKSLSSKIDTEKMKQPSFKMVITGVGDYAYQTEDGIFVVPIGALKQ